MQRNRIAQCIGAGQMVEDVLFNYKIIAIHIKWKK